MICIDGVNNLSVSNSLFAPRENNILIANKLKQLLDKNKIPVLATVELRKKDSKSSSTLQDIIETNKYAYNAQVILLLHPENDTDYKNSSEPLIQLIVEKNKLSSFKGKITLKFIKSHSCFIDSEKDHLVSIFNSINTNKLDNQYRY